MGDRTTHTVQPGSLGAISSSCLPGPIGFRNGMPGIGGTPQPCGKFSANHKDAPSVMTASLFAHGNVAPGAFGLPTSQGPFAAIVNFGSGNGSMQTFEVDLPCNLSNLPQALNTNVLAAGGVQVSVPCTSLELWARNDAALQAVVGDLTLGPTGAAGIGQIVVTGSMAVGNRPTFHAPIKTLWAVLATATHGLAPANAVGLPIPAFAKSVRVLRPVGQAISVSVPYSGSSIFDGPYDFAAGTPATPIVFGGGAQQIIITNTDAAELLFCAGLFEIDV